MFKQIKDPFTYSRKKLGAMYEEYAPRADRPKVQNWRQTLKRLWAYLTVKKWKIVVIIIMIALSSALALLGPLLVGIGIDRFIVSQDASVVGVFLLTLAVVYILHSVTVLIQQFMMISVAQEAVFQMRQDLFHHLHDLPIPFFDNRQHGDLMSRVTNDMDNISTTLNSSIIQVFTSLLTLIGTFAVMIWLSPLLTAITLTIVPLMALGLKWITKRTRILFKAQQRRLGDLNGYIQETMSGQRMIKSFSQEPRVLEEFQHKSVELKQAGFWAQTISGYIPKLMNTLNNVSFALIAGAGGFLAIQGVITIGVIVVFVEYARQFTRPLSDLANQFNTILSALAGAERVFDIMDEDKEEEPAGESPWKTIQGEVSFSHVSFAYSKESGQTIKDISLQARPGETVAFVGPTGAGKTTLIQLLSRFYEPGEGQITLDGVDINKASRIHLRQQMGFVLQEAFLFQGSLRENIRYGRLDATDEEVEKAAREANAHSFIKRLPNQYDTILQQDGEGISQGQKQLISIARALLADPKILVLDEATSNVDTITEVKIQEALERLLKGRTSFVIAHRLNTIQQADQIIVLQDGSITEKGSHEELMKQKGFYQKLQISQMEHVVS